jgi:hypothetical protein
LGLGLLQLYQEHAVFAQYLLHGLGTVGVLGALHHLAGAIEALVGVYRH